MEWSAANIEKFVGGAKLWGGVCPARALHATFIMTFPDSIPKFTNTQ